MTVKTSSPLGTRSVARSVAVCRLAALIGGVAMLGHVPAAGQSVILSITTQVGSLSPTGGTTTDETNFTFNNQGLAVTSFRTASSLYSVSGLATQAFTRRNAVNATQSSVWYQRNVDSSFSAPHSEDYGQLLLGNNLYRGSDNTFANGTAASEGNIERLDFVYGTPLSANTSQGFAVFDRGANNVHDAFGIALITGWDSINNVPTSYSTLYSQAANWTPATNVAADFDYTLFRYNTANNTSAATIATETGIQGIGGIVFNIGNFGVAPGTPIYGYSIFGFDVTSGGNSTNLLDWTNATYYPTNTNGTTGAGGIDLAAVNGVSFTLVPEPAAYPLLGLVAAAACAALRRRPRPLTTAPQAAS
jgi:hypothetical protein